MIKKHGFSMVMFLMSNHAKWIAKLVDWDTTISFFLIDSLIELKKLVKNLILFEKIKAGVKKAVKHISDFEETATELAIEKTTTM
jgi:hypothetical protein